MTQNADLLIYNGARVLPEHLIVQVIEHKNGGWDLNPKKEVKLTHIPTGLSASCMDDRSEHRNCYLAKEKLAQLLLQASINTPIDAKVGEVYETRNGGTATVTSLIGGGYRCELTNGMNYWHNAQGIANLGDIRNGNNLEPTEFDLVNLLDHPVDGALKDAGATMEDLADAAGILAAHGHDELSKRLLSQSEALNRQHQSNTANQGLSHPEIMAILQDANSVPVGKPMYKSHAEYEKLVKVILSAIRYQVNLNRGMGNTILPSMNLERDKTQVQGIDVL